MLGCFVLKLHVYHPIWLARQTLMLRQIIRLQFSVNFRFTSFSILKLLFMLINSGSAQDSFIIRFSLNQSKKVKSINLGTLFKANRSWKP